MVQIRDSESCVLKGHSHGRTDGDRRTTFREPPALEESTWHSYDRYLRLHVIPHIGAIPLQKLSPIDLNQLCRQLLDSDGGSPARRRIDRQRCSPGRPSCAPTV